MIGSWHIENYTSATVRKDMYRVWMERAYSTVTCTKYSLPKGDYDSAVAVADKVTFYLKVNSEVGLDKILYLTCENCHSLS